MLGDASQNVGEPCLGIDVVHLGGDDQAIHDRGSLATAIRAAEQPRLPTQSDSAHAALGSIIGKADSAIVEEAREHGPALEHVVHGLGDIVATRQLGALFAHPGLQIGDKGRAEFLPDSAALLGTLAVDRPLDLEQGIDPADHLQRQGRDHWRLLALSPATRVLGQIRHDEERAPGVDPTGCFQDRSRFTAGLVELAITGAEQSGYEWSAYETRSTRNQYAFCFHAALPRHITNRKLSM